jgi:hypothetical protein
MKKIVVTTKQKFTISNVIEVITYRMSNKTTSENAAELTPILIRRLRNLAIRNFMLLNDEALRELRVWMSHEEKLMGGMNFQEEWKKIRLAFNLNRLVRIVQEKSDSQRRNEAITLAEQIAESLNLDIHKLITRRPISSGELLEHLIASATAA